MDPPLSQMPAPLQEIMTCSARFKSTLGVLAEIRAADSKAAVAAKAQQLPQSP